MMYDGPVEDIMMDDGLDEVLLGLVEEMYDGLLLLVRGDDMYNGHSATHY